MGDAAFKKAFKPRAHRERAQPAARAKLGILEKHKDYIQRARNYHRKQDTLKALRIRASNRNPDEFNFGMIKSRFINGRHRDKWEERTASLPADMLKLMKSQDVGYLGLQLRKNQKKLERAKEELASMPMSRKSQYQHFLFAEDTDNVEELVLSHQVNPTTEDSQPATNTITPIKEMDLSKLLNIDPRNSRVDKKEKEIRIRETRVQQLAKLEYKFKLDRQLLQKGKRTKIGTDEYGFAKFKWLPERKK